MQGLGKNGESFSQRKTKLQQKQQQQEERKPSSKRINVTVSGAAGKGSLDAGRKVNVVS